MAEHWAVRPVAPEDPGRVWAYEFVESRTHDGRKFRILTIIDEASQCLALIVARQLKLEDVLATLADLLVARRAPVPETASPPLPPSGSASLHRRGGNGNGGDNALTIITDHSVGPAKIDLIITPLPACSARTTHRASEFRSEDEEQT